MKKLLLVLVLLSAVISCDKGEEKYVFNLANPEEYSTFSEMKLDDKHKNLIAFNYASKKEEGKKIYSSWSNFHQQIGDILAKEKFSWETNDELIRLQNKVYFDKNGNVKYYAFMIRNEGVSKEKKKEFHTLVAKNIKDIKMDLTSNEAFAQCGKVSYQNKKG